MIRSVVPMRDGSEMLFLGLTASDFELLRSGKAVRYSPDDLRKAGMKANNITLAMVYEETMDLIIQGVQAAGVDTETIYEMPDGDLRDPDSA